MPFCNLLWDDPRILNNKKIIHQCFDAAVSDRNKPVIQKLEVFIL